MNHLGLKHDEMICGALALGYYDGNLDDLGLLERKGNPITYID